MARGFRKKRFRRRFGRKRRVFKRKFRKTFRRLKKRGTKITRKRWSTAPRYMPDCALVKLVCVNWFNWVWTASGQSPVSLNLTNGFCIKANSLQQPFTAPNGAVITNAWGSDSTNGYTGLNVIGGAITGNQMYNNYEVVASKLDLVFQSFTNINSNNKCPVMVAIQPHGTPLPNVQLRIQNLEEQKYVRTKQLGNGYSFTRGYKVKHYMATNKLLGAKTDQQSAYWGGVVGGTGFSDPIIPWYWNVYAVPYDNNNTDPYEWSTKCKLTAYVRVFNRNPNSN